MKSTSINGWLDVKVEVLRRLHGRVWKPGDLLPSEAELAAELGCARTTVNRALQAIADEGLLERRRRGGTRVVIHPERKATFSIPVIRQQIEQHGYKYGYHLLDRKRVQPSRALREHMQVEAATEKLLYIQAIHTAESEPYVLENRWIDLSVVPGASAADFTVQSPNEWLVENIPFSGGDLVLTAITAAEDEAAQLHCDLGDPLFTAERRTCNTKGSAITFVQLIYSPGYQMRIEL